jgi:hypothetical protein
MIGVSAKGLLGSQQLIFIFEVEFPISKIQIVISELR